jgi:phosphoglycolate phosphatase-like HAD superfamily hydrolase
VSRSLEELLGQAKCILLDFDGPVCSIFAGWPAPNVAEAMRQQLVADGFAIEGPAVDSDDPLAVLREVAQASTTAGNRAEEVLRAAELRCVDTATATPGAVEFLAAAQTRAIPVAIVSNNSDVAVRAYLCSRGVARTALVSARGRHDARLMKPCPDFLERALREIAVPAGEALMIGDSQSDVVAARAAGTMVIALANRPSKVEVLEPAGADAMVRSMFELLGVLDR